jgi:hypothetical protein
LGGDREKTIFENIATSMKASLERGPTTGKMKRKSSESRLGLLQPNWLRITS